VGINHQWTTAWNIHKKTIRFWSSRHSERKKAAQKQGTKKAQAVLPMHLYEQCPNVTARRHQLKAERREERSRPPTEQRPLVPGQRGSPASPTWIPPLALAQEPHAGGPARARQGCVWPSLPSAWCWRPCGPTFPAPSLWGARGWGLSALREPQPRTALAQYFLLLSTYPRVAATSFCNITITTQVFLTKLRRSCRASCIICLALTSSWYRSSLQLLRI